MDGYAPARYAQANDMVENIDPQSVDAAADFVVELLKNIYLQKAAIRRLFVTPDDSCLFGDKSRGEGLENTVLYVGTQNGLVEGRCVMSALGCLPNEPLEVTYGYRGLLREVQG